MEGAFLGPFKTDVKIEYNGGSNILELRASVVSQNLEILLPDGSGVLESIFDVALWEFIH